MKQARHVYLDWFRNICMLAIVWGHFFPAYCTTFVYAFSVPAFFALSGTLASRQPDWKMFWKKNFETLILPYLIICVIKAAGHIVKHAADGGWIDSVTGILLGFHSYNDAPGAKLLWFVYTLLVLRILYQSGLLTFNRYASWIIVGCSILGAWFYSRTELAEMAWAVGNTLLALPYFMLGVEMKGLVGSGKMEREEKGYRVMQGIVGVLMLAALWWLSLRQEHPAYMYKGQYGDNLLLSFLFALTGMGAILLISLALNKIRLRANEILGIGGLLLLGFQYDLIHPLRKLVKLVSNGDDWAHPVATLVASMLIMLTFIPITYAAARWLPFLVGKRKLPKKTDTT